MISDDETTFIAGYAPLSGVCNPYKTQLTKLFGFASIKIIAHELGHK